MKRFLSVIALFALTTFFVGCEKFELEDHCPEEAQNENNFGNPQDYRVNDDSDSEESGANNKSLSADSNVELTQDAPASGNGDDTSDGDDDSEDNDDLINDDSDNEDEGDQPRQPNNNGVSGGGDNEKLR